MHAWSVQQCSHNCSAQYGVAVARENCGGQPESMPPHLNKHDLAPLANPVCENIQALILFSHFLPSVGGLLIATTSVQGQRVRGSECGCMSASLARKCLATDAIQDGSVVWTRTILEMASLCPEAWPPSLARHLLWWACHNTNLLTGLQLPRNRASISFCVRGAKRTYSRPSPFAAGGLRP